MAFSACHHAAAKPASIAIVVAKSWSIIPKSATHVTAANPADVASATSAVVCVGVIFLVLIKCCTVIEEGR